MEILPAIDLRDGKCVRLLQGDYNQQIDYADDPVAVAQQFEQAGATWLHMVDLDGAKDGVPRNLAVIERVLCETRLRVEVGGGMRATATVETLVDAGAARCVVGTMALENWDWFAELACSDKCKGHVALGLDARGGKLATRGWLQQTDVAALEIVEKARQLSLAAIIYTDIGRDGMLQGPNIEAMRIVATHANCPVIASGGVTCIDDVRRLVQLPIGGIIIGRAIYEKQIDLAEAVRIARQSNV